MTEQEHNQLLSAFINTSFSEQFRMLESVPELVSEASVAQLEMVAAIQTDQSKGDFLNGYAAIIRACLNVGVKEVYEKLGKSEIINSPTLQEKIHLIFSLNGLFEASAYLSALCGEVLSQLNRNEDEKLWANIQIIRSTAIAKVNTSSRELGALHEALAGYDLGLDVFSRSSYPSSWVQIQVLRAEVLTLLGEISKDPEYLLLAVTSLDAALEIYSHKEHPEEWKKTHIKRVDALDRLVEQTEDPKVLKAAALCCNAILDTEDRPVESGLLFSTLQVRADALLNFGIATGEIDCLHQALEDLDFALTIRSSNEFPILWARVQRKRARVLQSLGDLLGAPYFLLALFPRTMPL